MRFKDLPLHPLLVHVPVALLPTSMLWDGIGWWTGADQWWIMSFWTLAVGLAGALPAIGSGLVEFVRLPTDSSAESTATWHMMLTGGAVTAFLASLLVRGGPESVEGSRRLGAVACSVVGLLLLAPGGHLGATLVYRHGIGRVESSGRKP